MAISSKMKAFLFLVIILLSLFACKKENMNDCFTSTGIVQREKRMLEPFDSLIIKEKITTYLIEDTVNYIEIEAGNNLLENINSNVNLRVLTIENNNTCNWVRSYKKQIIAYVHYTQLKKIVKEGAGDILANDSLRFDTLSLEMKNGSGLVDLIISNQYFSTKQITGASDFKIKGKTKNLRAFINDLGYGDFLNLSAHTARIENASIMDCYVNASDTLFLTTRSSGSIYYTGEADSVYKARFGEGTISRIY